MKQQITLISILLVIGSISGGSVGCGSDDGSGTKPTVDSELFGIYRIDSYRLGEESCVEPPEANPPGDYLALYSYLSDADPDGDPVLAGQFCGGVEQCRERVRDFPGFLTPGYSFISGTDETGWLGWGISGTGSAGDQCRADVQEHVLMSTGADGIDIETQTKETVFAPSLDGTQATCRNSDAIESLNDDLPCKSIILLEATLEAGL